jgi:hypothetical protein
MAKVQDFRILQNILEKKINLLAIS